MTDIPSVGGGFGPEFMSPLRGGQSSNMRSLPKNLIESKIGVDPVKAMGLPKEVQEAYILNQGAALRGLRI